MSGAIEPGYLESRTMKTETPTVKMIAISADEAGQRIDNFLRTQLKGVPKSMIYRILRKGEVRVNKKRIKPEYKLESRRYASLSAKKRRCRRICKKWQR